MQFQEVIGQGEASNRLLELVAENRVPHALMFTGPAGSGKMALALAFASYLLGEPHEGQSLLANPAMVRNAEAMLRKWQHPDLHFTYPVIKPKGTSSDHKMISDDFSKEWHEMLQQGPYFTMEQWMTRMQAENQQPVIYEAEAESLSRKLNLKSSQGGYKVSIIWLPERMNITCANKLLKLLEEPPQKTVFMLIAEEPGMLLETIRSRVQRFDIKAIATAHMEQALISRRGLEAEDAHRVARTAAGSWLKAMEMLEADNENKQFFTLFVEVMRKAYGRDIKGMKSWSETVAAMGREKQRRLITYFMRMIRENFMYNFRQPELVYMTREEEAFATRFARFIHERNVVEMTEIMQRTLRDISQNANPKMQFFNLATDMIILLRR